MILRKQEVFNRAVVWVETELGVEIWEYPIDIDITEEFIANEYEIKKAERQAVINGSTE